MAAEKLTKHRLAQIIITLAILVSAFFGARSHIVMYQLKSAFQSQNVLYL